MILELVVVVESDISVLPVVDNDEEVFVLMGANVVSIVVIVGSVVVVSVAINVVG